MAYTNTIAVAPDGSLLVNSVRGLYRSTDVGTTWSFNLVDGYSSRTMALSGSIIYVGGFAQMRRSTNFGATWTVFDLPSGYVSSIAFNSQGHIFAGSSPTGVFRSLDGTNWTDMALPGSNVQIIRIKNDDHVFVGTDSVLFRSTNNGSNWSRLTVGISPFNVSNLYIDSNGDIYAGSSTSGFFFSTDNGDTWASAGSPVNKGNVLLRDRSGRLYAYHFGGLSRSTDNGSSWQEEDDGISGLTINSFVTLPSSTILAATSRGVVRSLDQGQTWSLSTSGISHSTNALAKKSDGTVLAAADRGVYRSTDGGATWNSVGLGDYRATAISVSVEGHIFAGVTQRRAFNDSAMIFRSDNNGASWNHAWGGYGSVSCLLTEAGGYIHAGISPFWNAITSSDGGVTWRQTVYGVNSMAVSPVGHLWAVTYGVVRSTDHGTTWTDVRTVGLTAFHGAINSLRAIAIDPSGNIFIGTLTDAQYVAYGSGVYRSTDDGNTWFNLNLGIGMGGGPSVLSLGLTSDSYLVVGTNGEGIYRSNLVTGIDANPGLEPRIFSLDQNYPNPFNPATQIRFSLPSEADVKLTIYSLLGQQVATILEGKLNAGIHTVPWNGRSQSGIPVASGVYFYRLTAGLFVETKKMLLLR